MNAHIVVDPDICGGKPVIAGARIRVRNILGMAAGGYSREQILNSYPQLTADQVQAAFEYAARVIDEEKITALG